MILILLKNLLIESRRRKDEDFIEYSIEINPEVLKPK